VIEATIKIARISTGEIGDAMLRSLVDRI